MLPPRMGPPITWDEALDDLNRALDSAWVLEWDRKWGRHSPVGIARVLAARVALMNVVRDLGLPHFIRQVLWSTHDLLDLEDIFKRLLRFGPLDLDDWDAIADHRNWCERWDDVREAALATRVP